MAIFTAALLLEWESHIIVLLCLQVQKDTVRKISDLSVDKLLAFFIQTKGTGKDIPSETCTHAYM